MQKDDAFRKIWHGTIRNEPEHEWDVTACNWALLNSSHNLLELAVYQVLKNRIKGLRQLRNERSGHVARAKMVWDILLDALQRIHECAMEVDIHCSLAVTASVQQCICRHLNHRDHVAAMRETKHNWRLTQMMHKAMKESPIKRPYASENALKPGEFRASLLEGGSIFEHSAPG